MADSDDEVVQTDPRSEALKNLPPVVVRKTELREDLLHRLFLISVDALKNHKLQKDVASEIKNKLDSDLDFNELIGKGPWQVIVGRSFATSITHESMHLAFFDIPKFQETILVYRSLGVQSL
uniref:Dynein light chain n=1 Tax=Noctiluca scintillans TaxID=2966 RepID=A0A7S1FGW5_NOCSC|eukprot:CAMPEP_0194507260 /NCGR_PEP_ID=MMETSP0253-20130528/36538_1 /TAXON_ID=2966 /ORGANISM="Noctiluca scintillans" /LENGTH=121 /DNA_ID=CAMNT_0039350127 /DNA_START=23 /DNA_END=388 /DNA_ORIENTATION=+